jgi:hypothetical protein
MIQHGWARKRLKEYLEVRKEEKKLCYGVRRFFYLMAIVPKQ